jgi:DhnA family fructose-bisphosphate aldolase class Ia
MTTANATGQLRRLARLFPGARKRAVFVALDATLIANAIPDPAQTVARIARARPDAVVGFAGLLRAFGDELVHVPTILNLTASTIRSQETYKDLVHDPETAHELGVDAIAVHVNVGGTHDREMFGILGSIAARASRTGLPVLAIMYPRSEVADLDSPVARARDPEGYAARVAHAVRIGVDLGADLVKTQFTGDVASFREVVRVAAPVPIVIAGGAITTPHELFRMTRDALAAGAAGVCYGRNVFGSADPVRVLDVLRAIVHEDVPLDRADQLFRS